MHKYLHILIALLFCLGCKNKIPKGETILDTASNDSGLVEQNKNTLKEAENDTRFKVQVDTVIINGLKYLAYHNDTGFFYMVSEKGKLMLTTEDGLMGFDIIDFDEDGYEDIFLYYGSNIPGLGACFLFNKKTKQFKEVENFVSFPASEKIKGTNYYYSYHRSGCADLNWDSDLFYIENFKAYRIGNIYGAGCKGRDELGVFISKVKGNTLLLIRTLPITKIKEYEDHKWGFIKQYWTKNYKKFVQ